MKHQVLTLLLINLEFYEIKKMIIKMPISENSHGRWFPSESVIWRDK